MRDLALTRRQVLSGSANVLAAGTLTALLLQKAVTVGFIYVGPKNDYGWNQPHAVAARKFAQMAGVKLIEQENVAGDRRGREGDGGEAAGWSSRSARFVSSSGEVGASRSWRRSGRGSSM